MTTAALLILMQLAAPGAAAPDEAVEAGRDALDRWMGYPWYDADTDGIQRVEIREPWFWDWDWGFDWDLGWPDSLMKWLAWIAIFLLLALLVYLLVRALLARREARSLAGGVSASSQEDDAGRFEALPLPIEPGRIDLLAEARRHYEQGNYGRAIVYLFGFQLVQLDRRQIIRLAKGKTNRQYLRELGPHVGLQGVVEQTMVAFEDVFFGNHTLDRARFESCWSRLGEFESLAE